MWIGISRDEAHRMKPSRVDYIENYWPLVNKGMSRNSCLEWMEKNKFPTPPRSACVFCPFHHDSEWKRLKEIEPEEWSKAVEFEISLQAAAKTQEVLIGTPFLHQSCKPLSEVDFIEPKETQGLLFGNECEGMCGV